MLGVTGNPWDLGAEVRSEKVGYEQQVFLKRVIADVRHRGASPRGGRRNSDRELRLFCTRGVSRGAFQSVGARAVGPRGRGRAQTDHGQLKSAGADQLVRQRTSAGLDRTAPA